MAQVVTRREVLSAYRYLLRSIKIAFQGDTNTLSAAKKEARSRFEIGRKLISESSEAWEGVAEARNVGKFLRQNIVQGIKDEKEEAYRLRIHDEIERGDNSTIKNPPPIPLPERKSRRKRTELS